MSISEESLGYNIFLLRGGDMHLSYGDDYQWIATVIIRGVESEVKGMLSTREITINDVKDIKEWLINKGVEYCKWERIRSGEFVTHEAHKCGE